MAAIYRYFRFSFIVFSIFVNTILAQSGSKAKKTLAILELSVHGLQSTTAIEIANGIRTELKQLAVFELIDPATVKSVLQDQDMLNAGICNQSSCAIQIGQLLGVDRVAIGSISFIDGTYSVNIRTIEINTGKIINDVNEYYNGKPRYLQSDLIPIIAAKMSDTPVPVIKNRKKPIIILAIIGGAAVIAVPVAIYVWKSRSDHDDDDPGTEVKVKWRH